MIEEKENKEQDEIVSECINCIIRTVREKKIEYIYTCKLFPLNADTEYKDIIGTYEECKDVIHSKKCKYNPSFKYVNNENKEIKRYIRTVENK